MKKETLLLASFAVAGTFSASGQTILAGIDDFDSNSAPTVTVTAPGITATATASASGSWSNNEGTGRGSSKDTTWGTFDGGGFAASATTDVGSANLALTNGQTDGEVTFTITNSGLTDVLLGSVHLDAVAFRPNAARTYAINVLAGSDITVGNVFTSGLPMIDNSTNAITHLGGGLLTDDLDPLTHDQHDDIDVLLTGLADRTLAPGEMAMLQFAFSNGTGSGGGHHLFIDNLAISTVVPEPSATALLLGLGALGFMIRRRR